MIFKFSEHFTLVLASKPWFVKHNYMYTFRWDPNFNLGSRGYLSLPVWVEIPFRALSLEFDRIKLAELLGDVLVYLDGDRHSSYPNDRVCVMRDLHKEIPASLGILENCFSSKMHLK